MTHKNNRSGKPFFTLPSPMSSRRLEESHELFRRIIEIADQEASAARYFDEEGQAPVFAIHYNDDHTMLVSFHTNDEEVEANLADLLRRADLEVVRIPSSYAPKHASFPDNDPYIAKLSHDAQQYIQKIDRLIDDPVMLIHVRTEAQNLTDKLQTASLFSLN